MSQKWLSAACVAALTIFFGVVSGCTERRYVTLFKIDFAEEEMPSFVKEMRGFSGREQWGRWTDADVSPTATIRFDQPLPKTFSLVLKGQSVPGYGLATIRVGSFEQEFQFDGFGSEAYVDVDSSGTTDTIEIIPVQPVSPESLNINNDRRLLGVGLIELRVEQ